MAVIRWLIRMGVAPLLLAGTLCAPAARAQVPIAGISSDWGTGLVWAVMRNGDLYEQPVSSPAPLWSYRGNMLTERPGSWVAGVGTVTYGGTWRIFVTNAGVVCTVNGTVGDCRGINNQDIFQITNRPADQVVGVGDDQGRNLFIVTAGGDTYAVFPFNSWQVTYLGNMLGPTPANARSWGQLRTYYR